MVRKSASELDKLGNQPIVKLSDQETPPDGANDATQGLTDHAGLVSMAAESNSNLALSSRQLLPAAVGDFSASRQVEYCPPPETAIKRFAQDVCYELREASRSEKSVEIRQGFQQFMTVVAEIVARQANTRGDEWTTPSEADPLSSET